MRQRVENNFSIQLEDSAGKPLNMTNYSDIKAFVSQNGNEWMFTGTVDASDKSIVHFTIPKSTAMNFRKGWAELQFAMTEKSGGKPISHDPFQISIGKLLWREGYGR